MTMSAATYIAFYASVGLYLLAAVGAIRYLAGGEAGSLRAARSLLIVGALSLLIVAALRWIAWERVPLTTLTDSLNLFILLVTAISLVLGRGESMQALLAVCLPPLALIALVNAITAPEYLSTAPRAFHGLFLAVHVGLAFFAYALFFVASVTSAVYVFAAQRLKHHRTAGLVQRLPSLERLDRTLYRLIGCAYPLFVITLILGLSWVWYDRQLLGPHWWLSPKVILSCILVVFYGLVFHARRRGRLRGPKLANHFFLGFFVFLVLFLVLGVLKLMNYNFWSAAS